MNYYFSKTIKSSFNEVVEDVKKALSTEGFGILSEIDVKAVLKKKLNVDFRDYKILGACNPPFAYKALQAEDKVGTMLPCNVVVQEGVQGSIEVAAVNPVASMMAIENEELLEIAAQIRDKLKKIIEKL
ncbi:MAG: DUF302 domain-containing protein [Spirochaetes bacterium]|nr:DUF302 domain-containing protein [Spirochaetota bacterium]